MFAHYRDRLPLKCKNSHIVVEDVQQVSFLIKFDIDKIHLLILEVCLAELLFIDDFDLLDEIIELNRAFRNGLFVNSINYCAFISVKDCKVIFV